MNIDSIFTALNEEKVNFILIGGMNFLLRHLPELTFDVDIWVRDDAENLERLNRSLAVLGAEWGQTEASWQAVNEDWRWLRRQAVFCLTTRHGALDVFREVRGLEGRFSECKDAAALAHTPTGIAFSSLSDEQMIACQMALPDPLRSENETPADALSKLKAAEEAKRDRAYDPAQRWIHIQQTIAWAEANMKPEHRRNRPRVHPSMQPAKDAENSQ